METRTQESRMKKATRTATAIVAMLGSFFLAGCSSNGWTETGSSINAVQVDLPNGKTVTCVNIGAGSVDCDWEGAQ